MASLSAYYPLPVVAGTTAGTYAEGNHSHELDELDASGIAANKVLTANGLDAASWEDSTGQVEEAPEDGTIYGRKDADWVDITEPANLQIRRGTEAEVSAITPLDGEPVWETDTKSLKIGDGSTSGGVFVSNYPISGTKTVATFLGTDPILGDGYSNVTLGSLSINKNLELRGYEVETDFTHVTGNTRGSGAVDLQSKRSAATQVASGEVSVIIGGYSNTASADRSVCIGGDGNAASGIRSLILGGSSSTSSGLASTCINGGTASGDNSITFGVGSNASGLNSIAINGGTADRPFMVAKHFGSIANFTNRGQSIEIGLRRRTTNNTPLEMFVYDTNKLTIPSNVALFGTIEIAAIEETNATEAAHYIRKFAIQNLGGTTSIIGAVTTIGTDYESDAGYDVSITADNAGDFLKVEVTGDSTKTLRWIAAVRGIEMAI
jgi:hypothetical protein